VGDFAGARLVSSSCRRPESHYVIFRRLAEAQLMQGDPRAARDSFQQALSQAQQALTEAREKSRKANGEAGADASARQAEVNDWLGKLACLQARLGDLPAAFKTLEDCPAGRERDQARIALARDRAEAADVNTARSLIDGIAVACAIPRDDDATRKGE
jgi:hypothetical protein